MTTSQPTAYHLRADTLRLLLAGFGCRMLYGYLPEKPAEWQQRVAGLADLVRQGVVQNTGTALRVEEPLNGWLRTMANATHCIQLAAPRSTIPDLCIYSAPGADQCVLCMPQPGYSNSLRLLGLEPEQVWPFLREENPQLALPSPLDEPPPLPDSIFQAAAVDAPESLPGLQFAFQLHRTDDAETHGLYVLRSQGCFALITRQADGTLCTPYREDALRAALLQWLKEETS